MMPIILRSEVNFIKIIDYQSVNKSPLEYLSIILDQIRTMISLFCLDYWHICLSVSVYLPVASELFVNV